MRRLNKFSRMCKDDGRRQAAHGTGTGNGQAAVQELPKRQVLLIFTALVIGMLIAAVDQTIVATALPTIVGDLGGLDSLSWVITAYLLTKTIATRSSASWATSTAGRCSSRSASGSSSVAACSPASR